MINKLNPTLLPWKKEHGVTDPSGVFITPPKIIYRYLSLKRAEEAISNKELFFAKPNSFNDPLDMSELLMDYKETKQDIKKRVDMLHPHKTPKQRKLIYNIYFSQPGLSYEGMLNVWKQSRDFAGVCCFSESPLVTLMWSHYADSHKGITLGFNIEPFPYGDTTKPLIQSINYMEKIIPMKIGESHGKAVGHWLFTKSHIWNYEQEVRAIFLEKNGLVSFDEKCLKEIYFGCRVMDDDINQTVKLLRTNDFHGIRCYRMKIDSSVFDVRPVEIESIK